jgi:hypothetical protein
VKTIVATLALFAALPCCSIPASAEPPVAPRCAAFPAFPDANCTGPVGTLNPYTGSSSFRTSGQVIENVEIETATALYIPASVSNVVFRNVRFIYTGPFNSTFTIMNNQGQNITFEDVEFDGRDNVARAIAGIGINTTVRGANIHNVGNGLETRGPLLIEDSYIHDIHSSAGSGWHADGIQTPHTAPANSNITIRHNTVVLTGGETGAISIQGTSSDTAKNVLIEHNLLAGGGYTMYSRFGQNYRVVDNHFSTRIFPNVGRWGIWYPSQQGIDRDGNVIAETGASAQ